MWQGRTLEGSGGSGVDFASKGCHFWSRVAKPWQGRTLQGSGGSRARFWTRGFSVEMSSLLVWRGQGRTL